MTEEAPRGSDSLDFNPIASSTMIGDSLTEASAPQQLESEKDSEPSPSSVCFADESDNDKTTRPIGPMQNYSKIVSETEDILDQIDQLMKKQRRFLVVCAYQIDSLESIVREHYASLLTKMETFVTNSNALQTVWFSQYHRLLQTYEDYALVLRDSPAKVKVDEIPYLVEESTLESLVEDVINGMFAGAHQVKVQRSLNTEVNQKMDVRKQTSDVKNLPWRLWVQLFEVQNENAKNVQETCFWLHSVVDILDVDDNALPKNETNTL